MLQEEKGKEGRAVMAGNNKPNHPLFPLAQKKRKKKGKNQTNLTSIQRETDDGAVILRRWEMKKRVRERLDDDEV